MNIKSSRALSLAAGLGAVAAFAGAGQAVAAVPAAGINCVAADGKINGRGATFQTAAQRAFALGFRQDVCGATPGSPADVAGDNMVVYNDYPAASGLTGSGNGLRAASCRSDAFAGSDLPYSTTDLANLNGAPGAQGGCPGATFTPPFAPNAAPFPATADVAAPVMSFPVAGASVLVGVNLKAADCGGTNPGPIRLNGVQLSRLMGGDITTWNDAALRAGGVNAGLANCNVPVTRVVRLDNSGTTGIFKNYLARVDDARSTSTACAAGGTKKWSTTYSQASATTNVKWPGDGTDATDGTCSTLVRGASSGAPAVVAAVRATAGTIGYADAADWQTPGTTVLFAQMRNGADTAFTQGLTGTRGNCNFSSLSLAGSTPSDNVGLNPGDSYASNNPAGDHINATNLGSAYPICGLTFALVYSGLADGSQPNAISRLTADQRRTLYSYFTYVLSPAAQERLGSVFYAPLPNSFVTSLRNGFQQNF
jgi:ABC-type phosphate transport system substrate-binding protein